MTKQHPKTFKSGETILKQGEIGTCAYIIEEGRVEIFIEKDGETDQIHYIGTRGEGAMIGEMAIVDNAPRMATVRALTDCKLLEITQEDFKRRLEHADPVLRMVTQVILTRYRDMLARVEIRKEDQNWVKAEAQEQDYAQHSDAQETIKIANDFESALKSHDIALHYQPIVNLQTGHVDGFEALMRWEHPTRGFVSPAIFIPIIEDTGTIVEASKWALKESLMALKRMENYAINSQTLFMSVNFSSHDFASADFVDCLYNTMSASDVQPARVHLEITERLLMGQPDNARDTLKMCRNIGMGISIDDFGTGYSSLSYLHYFPIDTLKIDRSFVKDMMHDTAAMELVRSIIGLAKNLKMKIIAEGAENKDEVLALRDLGCDLVQGYYFSKPLPEKDVIAFLRDNPKIAI